MSRATAKERGVLLMTQYHHPVPNFVSRDIAHALRDHGPVTVITAHPNYPAGAFYPGTRWWRPERTVEDGIVVWRLPMIPDQSRSLLRRALSYGSFLIPALLLAPFIGGRPHTVWVYQTPFTTAIAALWFKLAHRARIVYTCADLWPESFAAAEVAKPGLLMKALHAYRRLSNSWADAIVCSTRGTLERFAQEGVPRERLVHIPVWVQGSDESADGASASGDSIVYAGNLGPAQQLETVVQAAAELERTGTPVRFDLYGTGSAEAELRALATRLGVTTVRFHGRVTPEDAFRASARALAQIVSLRSTPLFRMTVPSKLAFSFAAAAPVLYGLEGESADIAAASGGAIAFRPGDAASLTEAVRSLLATPVEERARMRMALRRYYEENFARDRLLRAYESVFATAPAEPARAPALSPRSAA